MIANGLMRTPVTIYASMRNREHRIITTLDISRSSARRLNVEPRDPINYPFEGGQVTLSILISARDLSPARQSSHSDANVGC